MTADPIAAIAARMRPGGMHVAFTGAGISTESGIPDYRSQGGIWDKFRPVYFDEFMSSRAAREEYWRRWTATYAGIEAATPNPAHLALTDLFRRGLLEAVITQNIDGLHQASGLPVERVVELHGNTRRIRCMRCRAVVPLEDVRLRLADGDPAPECACGGYLKPDTISFGQAMPAVEVEKAVRLSGDCDLFLAVGSTLLVQPAAQMPCFAKNNGAFMAIVNLSATPCDALFDVRIQDKAGRVLPRIVDALADREAMFPRRVE
jgi:NAD-dependent deacetylase